MGNRHRYTPEEEQFIRDNMPGRKHAELMEMFNRRFGLSLTVLAIRGKIHNACFNAGSKRKFCPIGEEYLNSRGYAEVKVGPGKNAWKSKHTLIWEAANGPVPEGHVVMFADGDRSNFDPDNLLLVSRAEIGLMNRCGLIVPDKNLTKAGKMVAAIKLLIADRSGTSQKNRKKKKEANKQ
jgi:hypothetical protein